MSATDEPTQKRTIRLTPGITTTAPYPVEPTTDDREKAIWETSNVLAEVFDIGTSPNARREAERVIDTLVALGWAPAGKPVAPSMSLYELAAKLCRDERARHESLGWTPAHDEGHAEQLIDAARSYSWHVSNPAGGMPTWWPWEEKYWKPKSARLDLVRAGALYLAAEDAIQNAARRRTIHSSFGSIVQRLATEVLAREPLALLASGLFESRESVQAEVIEWYENHEQGSWLLSPNGRKATRERFGLEPAHDAQA